MSDDIFVAVITGACLLAAATLKTFGLAGRARSNLAKDVELYNSLPAQSAKRQRLLRYIDERVERIVAKDSERKRNPVGITLGVIFTIAGVYFSWLTYKHGGWWWWTSPIVGSILLIGIVGFVQGVQKAERDEKGNPIKSTLEH